MNFSKFFHDKNLLIYYVFLVILTYGMTMFNFTLHGDDWNALQYTKFQYPWVISIGRWFQYFTWILFDDNFFVPVLSMTLLCAFFYFSAILIKETVRFSNNHSLYIYLSIFVTSPFLIEPVCFKMGHINFGASVFFASLAAYLFIKSLSGNNKKLFFFFLSSFFLSLTASSYQPIAFIFVQIVLMAYMNSRLLQTSGMAEFRSHFFALFFVIVLGVIFYIGETYLFLKIFNLSLVQNSTYNLLSFREGLEDLSVGLSVAGKYFFHFLFSAQHMWPLAAKIIFLFFLIYVIYIILTRINRTSTKLFLLGLLALILFIPFSLVIFSSAGTSVLRYSALVPLASAYGLIISLAFHYAENQKLKNLLFSLVGSLVLISIFQHNKAATLKIMNNQKDFFQANRILNRIESHPEFEKFQKLGRLELVFIGQRLEHTSDGRPFKSVYPGIMGSSIINCDVMTCQFPRIKQLFRLIGFSDNIQVTYRYYSQLPKNLHIDNNIAPWPSYNSVKIFNRGFVLFIDDSFENNY